MEDTRSSSLMLVGNEIVNFPQYRSIDFSCVPRDFVRLVISMYFLGVGVAIEELA